MRSKESLEESALPMQPTRARMIVATVAVILVVLIVWKVIDYRMQPPPPPMPIPVSAG